MHRLAVALPFSIMAVAGCSLLVDLSTLGTDGGSDAGSDATPDVVVSEGSTDAGAVQLMAERVRSFAIDDAAVYFAEPYDNVVGRVGKDGTNLVPLSSGQSTTGFYPLLLVIDDTDVFWTSANGMHQCAKAGCGASPITIIDDSTSMYSPYGLAVDATKVYFADAPTTTATTIYTVPKGVANATVTTFVQSSQLCAVVNDMMLDGSYLYFTCDNGQVGRALTATGSVEVLSQTGAPAHAGAFTTDGQWVYYGQFIDPGSIFSMSKTGGAAQPIEVDLSDLFAFAIDSLYLYWVELGSSFDNGGGSLHRCANGQCSATATKLADILDVPTHVAVDSDWIYWCESGNGKTVRSGVWRMPKPP